MKNPSAIAIPRPGQLPRGGRRASGGERARRRGHPGRGRPGGGRFAVVLAALAGLWLAAAAPARATDFNTPRSLAMGGSLRAAPTGASALFLNPAGMAMLRHYAVEAFYDFHVRKNGHNAHSSVVDSVASKWVAAGLYYNLTVMRPDLYERSREKKMTLKIDGHETGIALAVPLGSRFFLGATVKYTYFKAKATVDNPDPEAEEDTTEVTVDKINNVGVDVGAIVIITKGLTFGVTGMNLVPQKSTHAPMQLGMGLAYSYQTYFSVAFDVLLDFTSEDRVIVDYYGGAEGFFANKFAVRAGTFHRALTGGTFVTAGFGYVNPKAAVDIFLVQQVDQGVETRLGFAVKMYVR